MKSLLSILLYLSLTSLAAAGNYRLLVEDPVTGEFRFAVVDLAEVGSDEMIQGATWTLDFSANLDILGSLNIYSGADVSIDGASTWLYNGYNLEDAFISLTEGELSLIIGTGDALQWDSLGATLNAEQAGGDTRHLLMLRGGAFGGNIFTGFSQSGASVFKGIQESPHFSSPVIVAYREYPGDTLLTDAPGIVAWQKGLAPHLGLEGYHDVHFFSTQFDPFRITVDGSDWLDQPVNTGSSPTLEADNITFDGTAPASPTSPGEPGQIIQSGNYLYVCVAADTWRRVALSTW